MRLFRKLMLAGAALAFALAPVAAFAQSQTPLSVKDGAGSTQSVCAFTVSANLVPCHALFVDSSGAFTALIQPDSSAGINVSTAATTQLVALSAGKKIYVTGWDVIAGGTGNFQLVYGTGSNCGTGQTAITGTYNLSAQAGISKGGSLGVVFIVPASNALCAVTSAAVQMSGSVSYTQF